jgi:dihydroneopterin aldolase
VIERARVRLTKPEALGGAGVPSLEIVREASWVKLTQETKRFGSVEIIHETREVGIYRLNVAPGQGIPLHVHRRMQETELVLSDGLLCQGQPAPAGSLFRWPLAVPHLYENPTARWQTILCVDSPPFIESDEILVEGTPTAITPESLWPAL